MMQWVDLIVYFAACIGALVLFFGGLSGILWILEKLFSFIVRRCIALNLLVEFLIWKRNKRV